jgi:hypothetical protein
MSKMIQGHILAKAVYGGLWVANDSDAAERL